jgi:hypothetical protein
MFDWWSKGIPNNKDASNRSALSVPTTPILLEIVGALGLATKKSSSDVDPYCIVSVGDKELHRTKTVHNDGNPIFTVASKALCLLEIPNDGFVESSSTSNESSAAAAVAAVGYCKVTVSVHSGFSCLGQVSLTFDQLLRGDGKRQEFSLGSERKATLALRFRLAAIEDITFLRKTDESMKNPPGLASDINFRAVRAKSLFQLTRKVMDKKEYIRTMPFPDPDRPEETKWMTREEMVSESLKPSRRWVSAGQGTVGKIYLEILGCDGLPDMDLNVNDQTDSFVAVVLEDTMVRTDVIWDELNPRWMPWTNRAFELRVSHPTSILMLGVFDYDEVPVDYHDPVGRVVISTANFRCNTEYVLHYKLHHDAREDDAVPRGTIIIRMRIEWEDESEAMKMSFTPAPRFIINVDNDKSYQVLRYLTRGAVDMESPSVDSVKLYADELMSYWKKYCFAIDVFAEVWLWRGRLRVSRTHCIWFPIHSVALFMAATVLVERPNLLFPIALYSMAWILLTINYYASRHPYPWKRVKKSEEVMMMTLFGRSNLCPENIEPGQGVEEGALTDKLDKAKAERMSTLIQAFLRFIYSVYKIYSKTSESSVSMTTATTDWSFLSGRLYYLHMMLKMLCMKIRLIRNFLNWESFSTDAFTTNCKIALRCHMHCEGLRFVSHKNFQYFNFRYHDRHSLANFSCQCFCALVSSNCYVDTAGTMDQAR